VLALDGEPQASVLAQFAREFDLSRPRVRQEIRVIEDLRRLAERELSLAREENRNMKIERHDALMRAQAAEASLRDAIRQLEEMGK
jgi:cell division septum initiation protein DivIVA